jgi:hypothetical protein
LEAATAALKSSISGGIILASSRGPPLHFAALQKGTSRILGGPGQGWCHRPVELSQIIWTMTGLVKTCWYVPWSKQIAYGISSSHHY